VKLYLLNDGAPDLWCTVSRETYDVLSADRANKAKVAYAISDDDIAVIRGAHNRLAMDGRGEICGKLNALLAKLEDL
jgi:hypothetical protein